MLKCTGDALCEGCYTRFVVPDGAARACAAPACDGVQRAAAAAADAARGAGSYNGHRVRPKDAVRLERGGTGFAATSKVEASTYSLLGVGSGLADRRGQLANGRSKFAGMRL